MHGSIPSSVHALLELVLRSNDPLVCDRILLETCVRALGGSSGALVRRSGRGWRPSVTRGESGVALVEAHLAAWNAGAADVVRPGASVARADGGERGIAAIVDRSEGDVEHALPEIEALLAAVLLLETSVGDESAQPVAPLPSRSEHERRLHHDLANTLTGLATTRALLDRLATELPADEAREFRSAVERECARAGELLADGLVPRAAPDGEECDPAEVLRDVCATERGAARAAGLDIVLRLDPALPNRCRIPGRELARIARNALVNSREASERRAQKTDGTVWIEAAAPADALGWTSITVSDDGPGFPDGELGTLLRAGVSRGKAVPSGLGLAGIRRAVRAARGTLLLERPACGGARIEITLPGPGVAGPGPERAKPLGKSRP